MVSQPSGPGCVILYFSSLAETGHGGQESLLHLVLRLDSSRFRAVVVTPQEGSLSNALRENHIAVEVLPLPRISLLNLRDVVRTFSSLRQLVVRQRIDILHSDGPRNTFYAGIMGVLQRKPVVWHVRSSQKDPYDGLLYGLCTRLILVANALKPRFRLWGLAPKCVTIHNGVDLSRFQPSFAVDREGAGFGRQSNDLVIVAAGRIEANKGQHTLIEAFAGLKKNHPNIRLLLAGSFAEPAYALRCRQRAAELGVLERVCFLGHVPDMHRLLPRADIFVSPSIANEAFSRAILEAMAAGLPVVATDVGGAREAVLDNETGFIVPAGSTPALCERLETLAANPELRRRMGLSGRELTARYFDIQDNVAQTCQLYRALHGWTAKGMRGAHPALRFHRPDQPLPILDAPKRRRDHV